MKEKKVLEAVLEGKCPRCRKGNMFTHSTYNLAKLNSTKASCDHCGLIYEREPGFFYGAMYVSYAFSVAIMLTTFFATNVLLDNPPVSYYIIAVASVAVLLYPINFRYSRILFLYLFGGIEYNPKYTQE